jgi:hypothetical protein
MKKLLIGVSIAAFAFAAATDVSSAAQGHKRNRARAIAHSAVPNCPSNMVPVLHNVASGGTTHWSCMKPSAM